MALIAAYTVLLPIFFLENFRSTFASYIMVGVLGAALGLVQSTLLRFGGVHSPRERTAVWILASVAGCLAATFVASLSRRSFDLMSAVPWYALAEGAYGAPTGVALAWLARSGLDSTSQNAGAQSHSDKASKREKRDPLDDLAGRYDEEPGDIDDVTYGR